MDPNMSCCTGMHTSFAEYSIFARTTMGGILLLTRQSVVGRVGRLGGHSGGGVGGGGRQKIGRRRSNFVLSRCPPRAAATATCPARTRAGTRCCAVPCDHTTNETFRDIRNTPSYRLAVSFASGSFEFRLHLMTRYRDVFVCCIRFVSI